jgi:predicted nucleic acid-binding protein
MGEQGYLIDSNVIIDWLAGRFENRAKTFLNDIINEFPQISVISKIEILGYNSTKKDQEILEEFMRESLVFNLTDDIISICISIRKKYRTKLPDAIIASTAIANNFTLVTRNFKDFEKVQNLELLNPYEII